MKIAITGASGHIGANLCRELIAQGHRVRVLVRNDTRSLVGLELQMIRGDILDRCSLDQLVEDAEVVVHLAAAISIEGRNKRRTADTNVSGTRNILDAVRKSRFSRRFIHFSSIHALSSDPSDKPLDETRPLALNDPFLYNRTKAEAENMVMEAAADGLDIVIINPTSVVGPNDFKPSLVGQALIRICRNRLPALVPGGFDWVDVRDVVMGTMAAIEKGRRGERYLLSGSWASLVGLNRMIQKINPGTKMLPVLPSWLARGGIPFFNTWSEIKGSAPLYTRESVHILKTGHRNIISDKAQKELGFTSRPFEETIRDTINWFREHRYL